MKKNVGKIDRISRLALAVCLVILAYAHVIPAKYALATYLLAAIIALTGFFRICMLYKLLGISTTGEKSPF